jgi:hypothetical protein
MLRDCQQKLDLPQTEVLAQAFLPLLIITAQPLLRLAKAKESGSRYQVLGTAPLLGLGRGEFYWV